MNHSRRTQNSNQFRWKRVIALAGFLIIAAFFPRLRKTDQAEPMFLSNVN